jgi:hypothetical protein
MRQKSQLVLPCDPEYTAHREAEKRRQETREWLLQRERASVAPSIVPDASEGKPKVEQLLSFRKTAQIFQDCDGVSRDFRRTSTRSGSTLPNQTA